MKNLDALWELFTKTGLPEVYSEYARRRIEESDDRGAQGHGTGGKKHGL